MSGGSNPPCSNYCLNACLELYDSHLRVLVKRDHGDALRVRQSGEAV
jgi:hypothetical protein